MAGPVSEPALSPAHSRVRVLPRPLLVGAKFRVQGAGFRVQGSGFRVQGSGFKVQGSGFGVQGSGFRVQSLGSTIGTVIRFAASLHAGFAVLSHKSMSLKYEPFSEPLHISTE